LKEAAGVCGGCGLWRMDATLVPVNPIIDLPAKTEMVDSLFRVQQCGFCFELEASDPVCM